MKQRSLCLLGLVILPLYLLWGQQNRVIVLPKGASVELHAEARGSISWQRSPDSINWTDIAESEGPYFSASPAESTWYRARILEGECDPLYSQTTLVKVSDSHPRMNIVFILVDDLGWRDLGCYGSDYYETPHIDRMASEGVRFTQAYSAHPVCSPTRASIATGQYPQRLHISAYIPGQEQPYSKLSHPEAWSKFLKMSEITYAEALKQVGYKTFHAGKWHLGQLSPRYHGFDQIEGDVNHSEGTADPKNELRYTQATLDFITQHKDSLFLAVISHNTVHVPLETTPDLEARYEAKAPGSFGQDNPVMGGMIESLDRSVGMVLEKLEALELMEKTYVIFFSDNGGLASATSNAPLRGGKSQLYEGGIRVPFLVMGPRLPKSQVVSYPVISNDLFPTMLSMAGAPLLPEAHKDGHSLMPLLRGHQAGLARTELFFHYPHYQTLPPHSAVRSGNWKLIKNHEDGKPMLFDLSKDPGEQEDLASALPQKTESLLQNLNEHLANVGAQMPTSNPAYDPERAGEKSYGSLDPAEFEQDAYLNWNNK